MRRWVEWMSGTGLAAAIVAVDQVIKEYFFGKPDVGSGFSLFYGVVRLIRYKNFGITASLPLPEPVTIAFSLIACGLLVFGIVIYARKAHLSSTLALMILLAGALGNLIDRIFLGYVRDWLLLFGRSAVNLADGAILIGGLWFLLTISRKKQPHPSP